jgi:hypothetical protein
VFGRSTVAPDAHRVKPFRTEKESSSSCSLASVASQPSGLSDSDRAVDARRDRRVSRGEGRGLGGRNRRPLRSPHLGAIELGG